MTPDHEVVPPATDDATPLPRKVVAADGPVLRPGEPTPEVVLRWIATAGPEPWFPSVHAKTTGLGRDTLDEPLNELRLAGLVKVAAWVRGAGQGYLLTPEGQAALGDSVQCEPQRPPVREEGATPPDPPGGVDIQPPIVVPILLAMNLVWFVVGLFATDSVREYLSRGGSPELLIRLGAITPERLLQGEWWRLLTCCFVHFGMWHLLANLLALAMMGPLAEVLWGRWRLLTIYLLAGLGGSCLAMAIGPQRDGAIVVLAGASGAIWGVMGAIAAWLIVFRPYLPPAVAADCTRRLGFVLVVNIGFSFLPGISWEGHLGGGVAGFLAAGLLNAIRFGDRNRRRVASVLLGMVPVLCVGGLVAAMHSRATWLAIRARESAVRWADVYDRDVAPRLTALAPDLVQPVETRGEWLVMVGPRRHPERVDEVRGEVGRLRAEAAEAADRLREFPTTGVSAFDGHVSRARAFAVARQQALDLLLALLDSPAIPEPGTVREWTTARREAHRLWVEVSRGLKPKS